MAIVFTVLGVSFAAFAVWLTVRIVKRKERWAKRTAVALALSPVLYVLSMGPNAGLQTRHLMPEPLSNATKHLYLPIELLMAYGPKPVDQAMRWYIGLWYPSVPPPDTPPHHIK